MAAELEVDGDAAFQAGQPLLVEAPGLAAENPFLDAVQGRPTPEFQRGAQRVTVLPAGTATSVAARTDPTDTNRPGPGRAGASGRPPPGDALRCLHYGQQPDREHDDHTAAGRAHHGAEHTSHASLLGCTVRRQPAGTLLSHSLSKTLNARQRASSIVDLAGDRAGVGMVERVEDVDRPLPRPRRRGRSTGRGQGLAELGEAVRLVDPGADRVEQLHRAAKAAHRRGQVAQVAVGVAEAVPGVSLALAVTEVAQDGERGTAMAQGLLVVTEQRLTVARAVERPCLAGRVVGAAERLLRAEGVLQRLGVPPRVLVAAARKSEAGVRLAGVVTEYLEDLQRGGSGARPPCNHRAAAPPGPGCCGRAPPRPGCRPSGRTRARPVGPVPGRASARAVADSRRSPRRAARRAC